MNERDKISKIISEWLWVIRLRTKELSSLGRKQEVSGLWVPAFFTKVAIRKEDRSSPWEKQKLANQVPRCPFNCCPFFFFLPLICLRHHLKHVVLPFHSLFSCGGGRCAKPVEEFMHSTGLRNTCEVFLSIEFLNISTFATILQTETSVCISQPGRTLDQVTCCGLF